MPEDPFALEWVIRHKSLAAININRARNLALEEGVRLAQWTLPLDGWCFFTEDAWSQVVQGIEENPDAQYIAIPLARIARRDDLSVQGFQPIASEEPQVAFRWDAAARFDEALRYGHRNKAELLTRLGVAGFDFRAASWDRP